MATYTLGPLAQPDLDLIAHALASLPWHQVQGLLTRLQQQVAEQDAARAAHEREQQIAALRAELEQEFQ